MRILVACECSNVVSKEFRKKGHYVLSCDLMPNVEDPTFHFKGDVRKVLYDNWDMIIAFPPCTHLAVSGAKHFEKKQKYGWQEKAINFFMLFANHPAPKFCIENPVGIMSNIYRKPDQIINPYYFGDPFQKTTCLWLKGLPKLFHAKEPDLFNEVATHVDKGKFITLSSGKKMAKWIADAKTSSKDATSKTRSKTFPGIARAMADQWG